MIPDTLDKFISLGEIKDKKILNYTNYSQEIQQMMNIAYSCCYRFCLRKPQIIYFLKSLLLAFEVEK